MLVSLRTSSAGNQALVVMRTNGLLQARIIISIMSNLRLSCGFSLLDPGTLWSVFTLLAGWTTCAVAMHIARNRTMSAAQQQCCSTAAAQRTEALYSKLEVSLLLPISSNYDCSTIGFRKSWTQCACRSRQPSELNTSNAQVLTRHC